MITYRDLLKHLKTLTEEKLDDTVTVYDFASDEFFGVDGIGTVKETDILDEGHIYLTVNQMSTTKSKIQDIKKGDFFFAGGEVREAAYDAHQNLDEKDEPWIVYDTEGNSWFEEDIAGSPR